MAKRVLLIEDFPIIQNLYGDALNRSGYQVDIVSDGKAALERVQGAEYDVILVDLLLPNVNGIEFLEKFTNRPTHTKVLILSDFSDAKTVEQAKKLGVSGYLIKAETTPSQLVARLERLDDDKPTAS